MKVTRIIYVLSSLLNIRNPGVSGQNCDPESVSPHAIVMKKRNGESLEILYNSGFIDLREYTHKLLCINGIAILYNDTIPGDDDKTTIFTRSDLKLYTNQCFVINQISTTKAIQLRNEGKRDVKLSDVSPSDIVGLRFYGIYLIGEKGDYYKATAVIFLQANWDYIMTNEPGITDGSFVSIGRGPFCLRLYPTINSNEIVLKYDAAVTDAHVCRWTKSDIPVTDTEMLGKYGKIFNGTLTRPDLEWRDCGSGGDGDGLGPFPIGPVTSSPDAEVATTIDPFSIIMDQRLKAMLAGLNGGSKRGRMFTAETRGRSFEQGSLNNRFVNGTGNGTVDPYDFSDDYIIRLDLSHCPIQLEPKSTTCTPDGDLPENAACRLLNAALGIPPTPSVPPSIHGNWKEDVLDVAANIFGKICEPFPPRIPFMIAAVFKELYLLIVNPVDGFSDIPKRVIWDHLMAELDRCDAAAKPMWWYWDNRDDYAPTEDEEDITCLIESCSEGCEPSTSEKDAVCQPASPSSVSDCVSAKIECDDASCVYDAATSSCIEDSGADPSSLNSIDCTGVTASCAAPGCNFNAGTCEFAPCKVESCTPSESCKPALVDLKCEEKTPEKGAYPIDGSSGGSDTDDGSMGGDTAGGGGFGLDPGSNLNDYPLNEVVVTHEIIRPPPRFDFSGYPINVLTITNITGEDASSASTVKPPEANFQHEGFVTGQCLFFYEDMAETNYDLNIAIDIFWKIWVTVIGYCNGHYAARKGETFPRLYNTFFEDFVQRMVEEWTEPKYNKILEVILSGVNDEIGQRWLDVCLESSYIVAQSQSYRPPRPVILTKPPKPIPAVLEPNYFLALPDHLSTKSINLNEVELVKCE